MRGSVPILLAFGQLLAILFVFLVLPAIGEAITRL